MRRATLLLFAMLVLAAAVAAAGCGGGGGGTRLTKDEFVAKADGICTDANKNIPTPPEDLKNVNPTAAGTTDEQLKDFGNYVEDLVKHYRGELEELRDIKPPEDLQDKYDSALAGLEESLNELDEAGSAMREGNREVVKAKLEESDTHSNEANALAKELGLTVCGSSQ